MEDPLPEPGKQNVFASPSPLFPAAKVSKTTGCPTARASWLLDRLNLLGCCGAAPWIDLMDQPTRRANELYALPVQTRSVSNKPVAAATCVQQLKSVSFNGRHVCGCCWLWRPRFCWALCLVVNQGELHVAHCCTLRTISPLYATVCHCHCPCRFTCQLTSGSGLVRMGKHPL
jgi:hypothetical protein